MRRRNAQPRLWRPVITVSKPNACVAQSSAIVIGSTPTSRVSDSSGNGTGSFASGISCSTRRPRSQPFDTTIRCRLRSDVLRSTARHIHFTMRFLYGRILRPRAACQRPPRPSIVHRLACRSGYKSSGLILRIARPSPLLHFLSGSSAVLCRLPVMPGNSRSFNARRSLASPRLLRLSKDTSA
jgi:hypothetical protein